MLFQPGTTNYTQGFGSSPENVQVPHLDIRAPNITDINFPEGKRWVDTVGMNEYCLTSFSSSGNITTANWIPLSGGGSGSLNTLTGDTGGPLSPTAGNINILGTAGQITTTGSGNTLTLSLAAGGPGIVTIDGDISSVTGETVTFTAGPMAGGTVTFTGNGSTTMQFNTTDGSSNTAIGFGSGTFTSGNLNVALGTIAMLEAGGLENVGIGAGALEVCTGNGNVGLGAFTLRDLFEGNSNLALGDQTGNDLETGSNNVLIAGASNYNAGESNNIIIANPGVNGESNVMRLGTTGSGDFNINQTFIGGVAGVTVVNQQTVTIDSSTGQLGSMVPVYFQAYLTAPKSATGGSTTETIAFDLPIINQGSAYDPTTGVFTAPVSGYYSFSSSVFFNNLASLTLNTEVIIGYTGSVQSLRLIEQSNTAAVGSNAIILTVSWAMPMSSGETVQIQPLADGTGTYQIFGSALSSGAFNTSSTFSGFRVS